MTIAQDTVTTIDFEAFRQSVFFTISLTGLSFTKKVTTPAALLAYYQQMDQEIEARKAAGLEVPTGMAAVPYVPRNQLNGKSAIKVSKVLLRSEALDALREHLTETKSKITAPPQYGGIANPSGIMEGLFELHKDLVPRVNGEIVEAKRRLSEEFTLEDEVAPRPGYLTAFLADYEAAINRAKTLPVLDGGLGPLFNELDYPTSGKVAQSFDIQRRWIALGIPEGLPAELRQQAEDELKADLRNAAEEIKASMREGFLDLLEHARDVMITQPGSKPKVIKDSCIGNVLQFCEVFTLRNTQADDQLSDLVRQCQDTLIGIDPDKCRKNINMRADAARQFAEIAAKVDSMITTEKSRVFSLDN